MNESELLPGDLIFSLDTLGMPEHVAIYLGEKYGQSFITHAIGGNHNCVMHTRLVQPDIGCSYEVVRPKSLRLSLMALYFLNNWVEHQVPYSAAKYNLLTFALDRSSKFAETPGKGGPVHMKYAEENYIKDIASYIRMSHLNGGPFAISESGKTEGVFCSEVIVYAFNMAYLDLFNLRNPVATQKADKRYKSEMALMQNSKLNPFPLSGKDATPWALLNYARTHDDHWSLLGKLALTPQRLDEEEVAVKKAEWRSYVSDLRKRALANISRRVSGERVQKSEGKAAARIGTHKQYHSGEKIDERRIKLYATPTKYSKARQKKRVNTPSAVLMRRLSFVDEFTQSQYDRGLAEDAAMPKKREGKQA